MASKRNGLGEWSSVAWLWSALGVLGLVLPACASEAPAPATGSGGAATNAMGGTTSHGSGSGGTTNTGAGTGGSTAAGTGGSAGTASAKGGSGGGAGTGVLPGGAGPAGGMGSGGAGMGGAGPSGGAGAGGAVTGGGKGGMGSGGTGNGGSGNGGSGGGGVLGPGLTDVGSLTPVTCTVTPTVTTASKIPTVGVATFTTDLAGADRAIIQFGDSTSYTLEAPVDWAAANHQTWLLGMPQNTDVHYRVVVIQGTNACVGADATYKTGAIMGAPMNQTPTKGTSSATPAPGFIIGESQGSAYIVNTKGVVVWAYKFPLMSLSRALMSWDGKYMYARDVGPFNASSGGPIYRVAMDGSGEEKLNVTGGTHHDLVAIPTGIAYPAKVTAGACDCIFTANADGSNSKCLVDLDVVFGKFANGPGSAAMEKCHVNAIRYYKDTKSYSVSDREKDAIAFISETGEVLGSVGAAPTGTTPNHAKAEGADSSNSSVWRVQHGHDQYETNKIILWSNGSFQGGTSKILHYTISGTMASLDWQYSGTGNNPTFSDAQHLPNGNFLATNSGSGAVHEVDATGKLVQSFPSLSKGYSQHRSTLYGPPPGR